MITVRHAFVPALVIGVLALSGCGQPAEINMPTDHPGPTATSSGAPTAIPAATGPVRTVRPVTVVESSGTGGEPVVCLGAVAESAPPQCDGTSLAGWDWDAPGVAGTFSEQSGQPGGRWGDYLVTGTWDGTTLTVASAYAASANDNPHAPATTPTGRPPSGTRIPADQLRAAVAELAATLPGVLSSDPGPPSGAVSVIYDDGSLEDYADAQYGDDVVLVNSLLVPAG